MEATVQRTHSKPVVYEANTPNQLLLVFEVPDGAVVRLGDKLEFPQLRLDVEISVKTVTRNASFRTVLKQTMFTIFNFPQVMALQELPRPRGCPVPNNAINTDVKHARAFGARVFAAGYGER